MSTTVPFDLVIFDCDGVLVDSEKLCVAIDVRITADLGCPFTEEEIVERFVGSSHAVYTAAVEERLGRRLPPGWDAAYAHLYDAAFEDALEAVDGLPEALDALDALRLPRCVASNGSHPAIARSLRLTGLARRFPDGAVFSAHDVAAGKPEPDLFLHAAAAMGADPARCAVVEDSAYGVAAARAAGMRAFGYAGGLTRPERLAGPATVVFDDMRHLPELLTAAR